MGKNIVINVHSINDVITNSSTTIYVEVHNKSRDMLIEVIDYILKSSGSDKKATDVFDIRVAGGEDNYLSKWDEVYNRNLIDKKLYEEIENLPDPESRIRRVIFDLEDRGTRFEEVDLEEEDDERVTHNRARIILHPKGKSEEENVDIITAIKNMFTIFEAME
jgi:hypothetical protein